MTLFDSPVFKDLRDTLEKERCPKKLLLMLVSEVRRSERKAASDTTDYDGRISVIFATAQQRMSR